MAKRYRVESGTAKKVLNKTMGKCFYCGCDLPKDTYIFDDNDSVISSRRNWDVDHVIPISKGGTYRFDNLVPACRTCNRSKGAR